MDQLSFDCGDKENNAKGKEEAAKRFSEPIPTKPRRPILKEIAPSTTASISSQDLSNTVTEEYKEIVFETVNASTVFDSFMSTSGSYDPFSSIVTEGTEAQARNLEELSLHDATEEEDMYYSMEHIVEQSESLISAGESVPESTGQIGRKSEDKMSAPSELSDANLAPGRHSELSTLKEVKSSLKPTTEDAKSDMTILADALGEVCLDCSYDSPQGRGSSNTRLSSKISQISGNSTFDWGVSFHQNLSHSSDSPVACRSDSTLLDNSRMTIDESNTTESREVVISEELKQSQEFVQLRTDKGTAKPVISTSDSVQIIEKINVCEAQANVTFQLNSFALEGEANNSQPALSDVNQQSLNESGQKEVFMVNLELRKFQDNEASKPSVVIESANNFESTTLKSSFLLESTNLSSMSPGTEKLTSELLSQSPKIAEQFKQGCVINSERRKSQFITSNGKLEKEASKCLDQQQNDSISLQETTEATFSHDVPLNTTYEGNFEKKSSESEFSLENHRSVNSEHLQESREVSSTESNICELTESPSKILKASLHLSSSLNNGHRTAEEESLNDNLTMELSAQPSKKLFKTDQQNEALNLTREIEEENTSNECVNPTYDLDVTRKIGDDAEMAHDTSTMNISPSTSLGNVVSPTNEDSPNANFSTKLFAESSKELFKTKQQNEALNLTREIERKNSSNEFVRTTYDFDITHKIRDLAEMTNDICTVNIIPSTPLGNVILPVNEDSLNADLSMELSAESYKDTSESVHQTKTWNLPQRKLTESISHKSANATYNSDIKVVCRDSRSDNSAPNSTFNADDSVAKIPLEISVTKLELDPQALSSVTLDVVINTSSESANKVESNEIKNDDTSVIYITDDSNSEKALEHLAKSMNQTIDVEVSAIVEDVISVDTSSENSVTESSPEKIPLSIEKVELDNGRAATVSLLSSNQIIDLTHSVSSEEVVGETVIVEESSITEAEKKGKDQLLSDDSREHVDGKSSPSPTSFETTKIAKPQLTIPKKIQCRPNLRTVRNKTRVILDPLVVKGDTNAEVAEDAADKDPLLEQYKKQEEDLSKDLARLQKELEAMHEDNMLKDKCILSHALDREANKDKICKYKDVMQQYEAQLKKQCNDMLTLKEESQKLAHDFSSSEMAFADLFRKYERAKEVIGVFQKNEAILIENNEIATSQIEELETKHKALKTECDDIIKRAQERVKHETDQNQQKIIRLQNKVKKLKIEASSLDVALKQKTQECAALAALCDDITSK